LAFFFSFIFLEKIDFNISSWNNIL